MQEIKYKYWDKKTESWQQVAVFPPLGTELRLFTGLLDKQGNEIYEGDIVILSSVLADGDKKVCKAVMDGWQSLFESVEEGFYCPMGNTAQNYREVIGNIYEGWENRR